jgi:uncharacterized membrane protein YhhN
VTSPPPLPFGDARLLACAAICLAACGVLVFAEWKRAASARVVAKVVASLAFLALGVVARPGGAYGTWIVVGLALGVAGDIALLGEGKRAFLAGLGAFLLGHLAYVVAMATVLPPSAWISHAGWSAMLPLTVASVAVALLWTRLGCLRVPVLAYVAVIVAMVIGALALPGRVLTAGALLFFASDLAVARDKFVGSSLSNKLWGLPAYYAGQVLIAWSLAV